VNRNVPLLIGDLTIAHGCVGELDDRVALELNQTSLSE
ncbi:MAG TPA: flagellar motor switch protein FliM, partial [Erythrobacter sp.]|nr:flagellar motor switch protein FliM [Erythrobacter sp.]HCO47592.1 flagellar motor switch protein FliM [Erythrobacter sp.]